MALAPIMAKFWQYELRTTDAAAARSFYATLFGHERAVVWPLHEEALARGAKPHWLGSVGVAEQELTAQRFLERGATALGPTRSRGDGGLISVVRDPGGAILAVTSLPPQDAEPSAVRVAFHALSTNDLTRAQANYGELFGWAIGETLDLGALGSYRELAWQQGGDVVGALSDIEGRPGVHPHWLFFFELPSLEAAMSKTASAGGRVLDPITLPSGARLCVAEDPQGAAFGMWERPRSSSGTDDAGTGGS